MPFDNNVLYISRIPPNIKTMHKLLYVRCFDGSPSFVVQSLSSCCPVVVQSLTGQRLDNERTTTGQRTVLVPVGSGAGAKEKQGWDGRRSPEGATEHRQGCSEAEPLHQITPSFQALKGRRTIMCFPSPPRGFWFFWHSLQGLRSARPLPVIFLFAMAAVSRYFS